MSDNNMFAELMQILPENQSLSKDSGLWGVYTEDDDIILQQKVNESFEGFILRYVDECMGDESFDIDLACILIKHNKL